MTSIEEYEKQYKTFNKYSIASFQVSIPGESEERAVLDKDQALDYISVLDAEILELNENIHNYKDHIRYLEGKTRNLVNTNDLLKVDISKNLETIKELECYKKCMLHANDVNDGLHAYILGLTTNNAALLKDIGFLKDKNEFLADRLASISEELSSIKQTLKDHNIHLDDLDTITKDILLNDKA